MVMRIWGFKGSGEALKAMVVEERSLPRGSVRQVGDILLKHASVQDSALPGRSVRGLA
jgi:hypothetical protein